MNILGLNKTKAQLKEIAELGGVRKVKETPASNVIKIPNESVHDFMTAAWCKNIPIRFSEDFTCLVVG